MGLEDRTTRRTLIVAAAGMTAAAAFPAVAQNKPADKVKVGVFPVSSTLPYFVAVERGFFKDVDIEPETIRLMGGPPNVAALMNQSDRGLLRAGHARGHERPRWSSSWSLKCSSAPQGRSRSQRVRSPATVRHAGDVCRDLRARRSLLWPEPPVPDHRSAFCALVGQIRH